VTIRVGTAAIFPTTKTQQKWIIYLIAANEAHYVDGNEERNSFCPKTTRKHGRWRVRKIDRSEKKQQRLCTFFQWNFPISIAWCLQLCMYGSAAANKFLYLWRLFLDCNFVSWVIVILYHIRRVLRINCI